MSETGAMVAVLVGMMALLSVVSLATAAAVVLLSRALARVTDSVASHEDRASKQLLGSLLGSIEKQFEPVGDIPVVAPKWKREGPMAMPAEMGFGAPSGAFVTSGLGPRDDGDG